MIRLQRLNKKKGTKIILKDNACYRGKPLKYSHTTYIERSVIILFLQMTTTSFVEKVKHRKIGKIEMRLGP